QAEAAAASVRNPLLKKWLGDALAEAAGEADKKREKILASIESSFDAVTNRVSGWYKRYATIWVIVFSILVAGGLTADSYVLGKRLWQDQAVRNAGATQASNLTAAKCPGQAEAAANAGATPVGKARLSLDQASKCVSDVRALGLPFGWDADQRP